VSVPTDPGCSDGVAAAAAAESDDPTAPLTEPVTSGLAGTVRGVIPADTADATPAPKAFTAATRNT